MSKRRGRNRKDGQRYPSGELHKPRRESVREIAATMPHRRALGELSVSAWAETPLGRLYLREEITFEEALAGDEFARRWHRYMAVIEGPRLTTGGGGRRFECESCPSNSMEKDSNCTCMVRKQEYYAARAKLTTATRGLVMQVVITGVGCAAEELPILKIGLKRLARYFGLTANRNERIGKSTVRVYRLP
jgi:hypothetical protein